MLKKTIRYNLLKIFVLLIIGMIYYYSPLNRKQVKISVIVPVYNAEKYLNECIESILNQTLKEIEIICINDGSTDNSGKILDEYSKKDRRIKVYTQQNQGVGVARNFGILKATGKYIGFVDSDDKINKYFFSELYRIAEKYQTDITATPTVLLFGDSSGYFITGINELKNIDNTLSVFQKSGGFAQWNKIYSRNYLVKHHIKSTSRFSKIEDAYFTTLALLNTNNIAVAPLAVYYYRIKTNQQTTKNIDFNRIYIYKDIMDYFYALNASKTTKEAWERVLISKFDQELLNELQIIDSEQNKKQYLDTYNSLFFDHFLESMSKEEEKEEIKNIPSAKDQEQMNKMFELLVKPEIKKIENKNEIKEEKRGYDTKETSDLEELIGETLE